MTNKPATVGESPYALGGGLLAEAYERHRSAPDVLDPTEDLLVLRALCDVLVNKGMEITEALLSWYAGSGEKPPSVPDLDMMARHLTNLVKTSDQIHARRNQYRITATELSQVAAEMADVVMAHVDPETFALIMDGWSKIKRPSQ